MLTTGKSKHRREAIIPLYDALRAVLAGDSEALDHDPDERARAAVDRRRLRHVRSIKAKIEAGMR